MWKLLKVTAVYVLSLRTVLFHTVYMSEQKCSGKVRNVWHMQSTWDCPSVSMCNGTLKCRSHRSGRQRERYCCRNCAGFESSPSASFCGTSFLNVECRSLGAIYWELIQCSVNSMCLVVILCNFNSLHFMYIQNDLLRDVKSQFHCNR